MTREESETLQRAARLVRTLADVENAYISDGWLTVGLILSPLDPIEIREVADWVATFAQNRSGTDSGRGHEKSPPNDGTPLSGSDGTVREDPPSPSATVTTLGPLTAESTAPTPPPYDWENDPAFA